MSDDAAQHFAQEEKPEAATPQGRSVTLSVTLHPNGQIEFSLPSNKVLAHGLLGVAQEQLAKLEIIGQMQQQARVTNGGGVAGLMKKMGRG